MGRARRRGRAVTFRDANSVGDNLVLLREGRGPTTAFVHPASGLATAFRTLVPHLAAPGRVYAFENVEPGPTQLCTIAALGADYWKQLRDHVLAPIVLAGWSFGGPVALEIAALAEADGVGVAQVVLIDSGTPELLATRTETEVERLAGLFELDRGSIGGIRGERALELVAARLRVVHGNDSIDVADLRPFVEAYDWHVEAARRPWHPPTVNGPVLLVRARDEAGWQDAPADLGWSRALSRRLEPLWTPGTHYSLMSAEHAQHLANLLNGLLIGGHPLLFAPVTRPPECRP
jgi:thioesterase domain-containing protein